MDRITHTQSELGPLLKKAVPEGHVMRCIVKREKGLLKEDLVLCIQEPGEWENDKKHHRVLLAQKKVKSSNRRVRLPPELRMPRGCPCCSREFRGLNM